MLQWPCSLPITGSSVQCFCNFTFGWAAWHAKHCSFTFLEKDWWNNLLIVEQSFCNHTSFVLYFGFKRICCLKTSINRSMTVLLNVTPSKIVIGLIIRSCRVLKSNALIRIINSETPTRVGFTLIFTNCIVSVETSLKSCESLCKWKSINNNWIIF